MGNNAAITLNNKPCHCVIEFPDKLLVGNYNYDKIILTNWVRSNDISVLVLRPKKHFPVKRSPVYAQPITISD
jgi:hypothetical protein